MVSATLDFLGEAGANKDNIPVITIEAGVIGESGISGPIEFQGKAGGRMRIARQNRQQPNSIRHPAWSASRGFPSAPDGVGTAEEAKPYFPEGGLRIYIAKTVDGEYYAGYKTGPRPVDMKPDDPAWDLFSEDKVGGVIHG